MDVLSNKIRQFSFYAHSHTDTVNLNINYCNTDQWSVKLKDVVNHNDNINVIVL